MLFFVLSLWKPGSILYSQYISIWPGHLSSPKEPHTAGGLPISASPFSFLHTLQGPRELSNRKWKSNVRYGHLGESCVAIPKNLAARSSFHPESPLWGQCPMKCTTLHQTTHVRMSFAPLPVEHHRGEKENVFARKNVYVKHSMSTH